MKRAAIGAVLISVAFCEVALAQPFGGTGPPRALEEVRYDLENLPPAPSPRRGTGAESATKSGRRGPT